MRLAKLPLCILAIALGACGKTEPAAPAAAAAKSAAGIVSGRVLEEGGNPINVPGAKITLALWGVATKSGEKVSFSPKVNPDGTFSQTVPEGSYHFGFAHLDIAFNGKPFMLDLEPVGDDHSDRDSAPGIVQNYTWKLTGVRPGHEANEANFTNWYGASVNMRFGGYRNDIKKSVPPGPAGAKYVFTLIPTSNLIDGKPGKPLSFTREMDPLLGGLKNGNLADIPIADYTVTGEEIAPDGSHKPLLMETAYAKYENSAPIKFEPGASTGPWPRNQTFTRP